MRHNKLVIAAVAACIVLSAATIDAQSWKRGLGKLKQGVEQVTRQSKPNTTRQSGDVQVPEWHEERAQKRTSGLPSSVDTVVNHLRYRLRPDKRYAEFMGVDDYLFQETEVIEILGFVNFKGVRCSVTEINSEALKGETAHTLVIPSSVKEIGPYAFAYMNNLKSVKVPSSVRTIKRGAFAGCTNLSSITIEPGVTLIEGTAFAGTAITSITLPNTVKDLQTYAFSECKKLTTVKFPVGIKKISENLFEGCESITSVVVPSTVTEIGSSAYSGCKRLSSVTLPEGLLKIGDGAFMRTPITKLVIPSTVVEMGTWAFFCPKLTSVTLPARFNDPWCLSTFSTTRRQNCLARRRPRCCKASRLSKKLPSNGKPTACRPAFAVSLAVGLLPDREVVVCWQ